MLIRENVPIASLTTMRLGGNARFVVELEQREDIPEAYKFAHEQGLPTWVMGAGANTIGHDEGFPGVVLLNRIKGISVQQGEDSENLVLTAMGGETWDDLVATACKLGYSGIEAMSMIPGTVGAAPVQNIGAYGQDMAGVIERVKAYDIKEQKFVQLDKPEMRLGYRQTRFNSGEDAGRLLIYAVTIKLSRNWLKPPFYNSLQKYLDDHNITEYSPQQIREAVCKIREEKLPDPAKIASAGSFFKNIFVTPEKIAELEARGVPVRIEKDGRGKINSGWLIEQCGLRGKELFGFKVSEKAALVLINENARSYENLAKARQVIIDEVFEKFDLRLEQEPVEIPVI